MPQRLSNPDSRELYCCGNNVISNKEVKTSFIGNTELNNMGLGLRNANQMSQY